MAAATFRPRSRAVATGLALAVLASGCQSTGTPARSSGPVIDPVAYLGHSESQLVGALGQPHSARNELDAQVWQYAGTDCVVDFYLYPEGGVPTVAHAEARNRTTGAPLAQCARGAV